MGYQLADFTTRASVQSMRKLLRAAIVHPKASLADLTYASGLNPVVTSNTLMVLEDLGLMECDGRTWHPLATGLRRSSKDAAFDEALRQAVLGYRPFESAVEGLLAGESMIESLRHVAVSLSLRPGEVEGLSLLAQWAVDLGILNPKTYTLCEDLAGRIQDPVALPVHGSQSTGELRLWVAGVLGRNVFEALDEIDRSLLTEAAQKCDSAPTESVAASGQAVEDFLRELCIAKGLAAEASSSTGPGQLVALLKRHNLVHPHQARLVEAVSAMRAAAAHKKDKETVQPWEISSVGARATFGNAATAIRSIHEQVFAGRQVL